MATVELIIQIGQINSATLLSNTKFKNKIALLYLFLKERENLSVAVCI